MHLFHWNVAYGDITTAKTHPDGTAVLALLFDVQNDNQYYDAVDVIVSIFKN